VALIRRGMRLKLKSARGANPAPDDSEDPSGA
jgi:hypothetical protein